LNCIVENLEAALIGADLDTCDRIHQQSIQLWAAGEIDEMDAIAIGDAVYDRRQAIKAGQSDRLPNSQKDATDQPREPIELHPVKPKRATAPRQFNFGPARPLPLDRNAKARIMTFARAQSRRTEPGQHYGELTAKAIAVLQALLWQFHNAGNGKCFPAYEAIAAAAGCARSTVAAAIKALEAAGLLSWVNRVVRVRARCRDLFGFDGICVRVRRTSNAYRFNDPIAKSEIPMGTSNQVLILGGDRLSPAPERAQRYEQGRERDLSYASSA
jgi:hypothetical protein